MLPQTLAPDSKSLRREAKRLKRIKKKAEKAGQNFQVSFEINLIRSMPRNSIFYSEQLYDSDIRELKEWFAPIFAAQGLKIDSILAPRSGFKDLKGLQVFKLFINVSSQEA